MNVPQFPVSCVNQNWNVYGQRHKKGGGFLYTLNSPKVLRRFVTVCPFTLTSRAVQNIVILALVTDIRDYLLTN